MPPHQYRPSSPSPPFQDASASEWGESQLNWLQVDFRDDVELFWPAESSDDISIFDTDYSWLPNSALHAVIQDQWNRPWSQIVDGEPSELHYQALRSIAYPARLTRPTCEPTSSVRWHSSPAPAQPASPSEYLGPSSPPEPQAPRSQPSQALTPSHSRTQPAAAPSSSLPATPTPRTIGSLPIDAKTPTVSHHRHPVASPRIPASAHSTPASQHPLPAGIPRPAPSNTHGASAETDTHPSPTPPTPTGRSHILHQPSTPAIHPLSSTGTDDSSFRSPSPSPSPTAAISGDTANHREIHTQLGAAACLRKVAADVARLSSDQLLHGVDADLDKLYVNIAGTTCSATPDLMIKFSHSQQVDQDKVGIAYGETKRWKPGLTAHQLLGQEVCQLLCQAAFQAQGSGRRSSRSAVDANRKEDKLVTAYLFSQHLLTAYITRLDVRKSRLDQIAAPDPHDPVVPIQVLRSSKLDLTDPEQRVLFFLGVAGIAIRKLMKWSMFDEIVGKMKGEEHNGGE